MARRSNENLKNKHTIVLGKSGCGKSYWLAKHPWITKKTARLVVFDPYETHDAHFCKTKTEFVRELAAAERSRGGFRIGLSITPTPANFEFFCRAVWAILDGGKGKELLVLIEELADMERPGKAGESFGRLVRVGRKYGAVIMATSQRPQEITKTLFTQVSRIWCGLISAYDYTYVEKNMDLPRGVMQEIKPESYRFAYTIGPDIQYGGPGQKRIRY